MGKFIPDETDDSISPSFSPEEYSEENYDAVENLTSIPTTVSTEGKIFFLTITSIFLEGQEWG